MKKRIVLFSLVIAFLAQAAMLFGQDQDAAGRNNASLAPLFLQAVNWTVNLTERGRDESTIRQMCLVAVAQIEKFSHTDARMPIWKLFLMDNDSNLRTIILKAIAVVGKGDKVLAGQLNVWLDQQNQIFSTGKQPQITVVVQCVKTLGALDQDSSFQVVFNTMNASYSNEVTALCRGVLLNLTGDFKALLLSIIGSGSMKERRQALDLALESAAMKDSDKGDVAETAFDTSLKISSVRADDIKELRFMRHRALLALSARSRSTATANVIKYFDLMLLDFVKNIATKLEIIDIIKALGNMTTNEAAVRLSKYLDELNGYTENKKVYDEQIVTAVLQSLGKLGDKVAFDYLMRVKFLNYTAAIKVEADAAIAKIKW
jgi:hypothetical protein